MFKKLISAAIVLSLAFTPIGNFVFKQDPIEVNAKGYKSGKRSFKPNNNTNSPQLRKDPQQQKKQETNSFNKNTTKQSNKGGFMKGLMLGGLAGLLFGGLLGNMGILGSIFGLLVNVIAIIVLIAIVRKVFTMLKRKRKDEDYNSWRR